ncbi:hypothetical protein LEM8419_01336 [Neolewinella maritima]|uniref:Helix-hairpin-helix domain-containing protein n=1 Tax=Neolewinella maritima TaxID=1383882 RepID=A0ABM9AZG6_9BACT|nr:helix-hairpin-helix domain-containing protein [Neolewinella maritima]CAH1000188.1 hypothetical protein LEM8419_01336 [Neolewinella maritima]
MPASTPPRQSSTWSYTRAQRAGLLLLLVFIAACAGVNWYFNQSTTAFVTTDDDTLVHLADSLRNAHPERTVSTQRVPESFPFDPNTVTAADLQRLGLSEKQAASVLRYRSKRPFRRAEELASLYVLRPEQAARLAALARIPELSTEPTSSGDASSVPRPPAQRFPFDPNTLPADSLQLLGLSERQARALVKYRSYREMTFRQPQDLYRMGALDSQLVTDLLPLMRIALPIDTAPAAPPQVAQEPIDVNSASVMDWQSLPGIGPFRAAQIVKYRDRLGGFAAPQQVADTYGLPDSSYQLILPLLRVVSPPRPLYINRADAATLAAHPYLDRRTAEIIVRYRNNHGAFISVADLEKVRALTAERSARLLPYLNFD